MPSTLEILRDPYIQVTYLFVTGVAAIYCLIGLWAATSPRHWFLRAIIPCLALAALIPIRAHEPLIFYALIMGEIVAAVTLWRWWRGRRHVGQVSNLSRDKVDSGQVENLSHAGRLRFGLRDLLLLMVVVGVVAWTIAGFVGVGLLLEWQGAIVASLLLAGLTLGAWSLVTARRKRLAVGILLGILVVAVTVEFVAVENWLKIAENLVIFDSTLTWERDATLLSFLYCEFTGLLLAPLVLGQVVCRAKPTRVLGLLARAVICVVCVAAAIPIGSLYCRMTVIPAFPPPVTLAENAYPEVILVGKPLERLASVAPEQAQSIYEQLVPLLKRPGHVPADISQQTVVPVPSPRMDEITTARSIARGIDAQAAAFGLKGKYDEAAACGMNTLKLSRMQAHGGGAIDALVGFAIEGIGWQRLGLHRSQMSATMQRRVIDYLQSFDAEREPMSLICARDAAVDSRALRWRFVLEDHRLPYSVFGLSENRTLLRQLTAVENQQQARCRLLCTDLAIRLFKNERGRLPTSLDELVPEYLRDIPIDPFTDTPLVFRFGVDHIAAYSIGPDGIDNGGTPKAKNQNPLDAGIDWDLDSLVEP